MEKVVLKLGGSVFSKSSETPFDFKLARQIGENLNKFKETHQFIITMGGGYLARSYQNILKEYDVINRDLDWAGTVANSLNATMMRIALGKDAEEQVLMNTEITNTKHIEFNKTFQLIGGEKPGQTGDMVAINLAQKANADSVILMKDVAGVYSEDPDKNPDATLINKLSWDDYKNIMGEIKHVPGGNFPVDPTAASHAETNGIEVFVIGNDFGNLINLLEGKDFVGSVIK